MRRIALLGLITVLSGCESNTWWNPPLTGGYGPNAPQGDSINLRRVMGTEPAATPLYPEPGDIWPGPLPTMPSLLDVEKETGIGGAFPNQAPPPGVTLGPPLTTQPGSSVPIPNAPLPRLPSLVPQGSPGTQIPAPPSNPAGRTIQSPTTPGVTSGGTPGYQTTTTPGGAGAIVVPNGNGTSTVIYPDGRIETVPTPK